MITAFAKKVVKNCGYAIAAAAIALSLSPAMAFAAPTSPTDVGNTMLTQIPRGNAHSRRAVAVICQPASRYS